MDNSQLRLADTTVAVVEHYWASTLGCTPHDLRGTATLVLPLSPDDPYWGVFLFRRDDALVITVPAVLHERLKVSLQRMSPAEIDDDAAVAALVAHPIDRMVGPAYLGYADQGTFVQMDGEGTRLLGPRDVEQVARLRAACSTTDWEHGGSTLREQPLAGRFVENELVSLASYVVWDDSIAHISVITHPAHRRRGYGHTVVSAMSAEALRRGLIPQYRTLISNIPSVTIAAGLGFQQFATTLAVRLQPAEPDDGVRRR